MAVPISIHTTDRRPGVSIARGKGINKLAQIYVDLRIVRQVSAPALHVSHTTPFRPFQKAVRV